MGCAVPEKWSLFKEKVPNKDFLTKIAKNGPYLVLILSKSPYFLTPVCEKNDFVSFAGFLLFGNAALDCLKVSEGARSKEILEKNFEECIGLFVLVIISELVWAVFLSFVL